MKNKTKHLYYIREILDKTLYNGIFDSHGPRPYSVVLTPDEQKYLSNIKEGDEFNFRGEEFILKKIIKKI